MKQHLNNDELLDRMYGLGESNTPHLRECAECSNRLQALERKRAELAAAAPVSNDFLMAQRRAIYARLDQAPAAHLHWAPAALGVAFLLVTGVFLVRPHLAYRPAGPSAPAAGVVLSEDQSISDLYSMEQSVEPLAALPIHALFEPSESEAAQ
jgi:hypothetical protein